MLARPTTDWHLMAMNKDFKQCKCILVRQAMLAKITNSFSIEHNLL